MKQRSKTGASTSSSSSSSVDRSKKDFSNQELSEESIQTINNAKYNFISKFSIFLYFLSFCIIYVVYSTSLLYPTSMMMKNVNIPNSPSINVKNVRNHLENLVAFGPRIVGLFFII